MSKISDNGKKKSGRAGPIDDSEIFAMYDAILTLFYDNPEGLDIPAQINKIIHTFISYDFLHFLMDAQRPDRIHGPLNMIFEKWEDNASSVAIQQSNDTLVADFNEAVDQNYQS